ncbi:hypothetical protein C8T65DRAFT_589133 [Cerioporus squamosus]|nr:hypothetical protein C8T65DRAFT_589133 [Cerioporus squamosus]
MWKAWLCTPGRLRILAYRCLAFIGQRWYGFPQGTIQRLPFDLYMKYGPRVRSTKAAAMKLVSQHTTIPVPWVLDTLQDAHGTCILMTRLPGVSFGEAQTLYDLSSEQLHNFETTLRDWFSQLQSIPLPPTARISSVDGSACHCYRVSHDRCFGPFETEDQLYDYILRSIPKRHHAGLQAKLDILRSRPHCLVFSHADLHPNNLDNSIWKPRVHAEPRLPIRKPDWECAGWYPEYWDYTNALYLRAGYRLWCEVFTSIFPQYGPELEVEDAFWMVGNPF